jgi:hypothetical protein
VGLAGALSAIESLPASPSLNIESEIHACQCAVVIDVHCPKHGADAAAIVAVAKVIRA